MKVWLSFDTIFSRLLKSWNFPNLTWNGVDFRIPSLRSTTMMSMAPLKVACIWLLMFGWVSYSGKYKQPAQHRTHLVDVQGIWDTWSKIFQQGAHRFCKLWCWLLFWWLCCCCWLLFWWLFWWLCCCCDCFCFVFVLFPPNSNNVNKHQHQTRRQILMTNGNVWIWKGLTSFIHPRHCIAT